MAQNLGLGRESYDHLLVVAGRVTEANAPSTQNVDYDTPQGRIVGAIEANERSRNLDLARAESARAVLVEILGWSPQRDTTEADLAAARKVLKIFIEGQEASSTRWEARAEAFRRGENPDEHRTA